MHRIIRCSLALSFMLLIAGNARAQSDITIYADDLGLGWADWSWCSRNLASTDTVHGGTHSAKLTYTGGFQGFYMRHAGFDTSDYTNLVFWINGGSAGNRAMTVAAHLNDQAQPSVPLAAYVDGGFVAANTWRKVTIPLAALGVQNRANFNGFWIQDASGSAQPPFYVDDIVLQSAPPPAEVLINVDAGIVKRTVDARLFGLNAAVWDDKFNTASTVSLLSANRTRLLRFPGGSLSDEYHWRTNTTLNNTFQWATNFDAFTSIALALNAQAVITANYGTGTPQEAADWVQYANLTKHLGFKYWEIGNECYGGWETDARQRPHDPYSYAVAARDYITAMKAVDPTIKIGIVVLTGEDSWFVHYTDHVAINPRTGQMHTGWTPVLLQTLRSFGVTPDYVIYHRYDQNPGGEDDAGLLQSSKSWAADAADLRQQLNDYFGAQAAEVELVCTETNSVSSQPGKQTTSLVGGLFYADNFGQILQTEFTTRMWWDLRNGQESANNNNPLLYGWRSVGDYGLVSGANEPYPTYYASKLMSLFTAEGDQVVQATSNYRQLAAYAVKRTDGALALLLINKSMTGAIDASISLAGFAPPSAATVHSYGKPQDDAARTGSPSTDIATTMINNAGARFVFSAPPLSMNVIVMGGTPCSVNLSPASEVFAGAGGDAQINVTIDAGCNWTAATNEDWIILHTPAGSGSGAVNYTVLENPTGQVRQGQITIGARAFNVTQEAAAPANCTVTVTAPAGKLAGSGGTAEITVTASAAGCPWQATTNVNWITITAGSSGTGDGAVRFTFAPNPESHKRKAKFTIAGNVVILKQKPGA
jgi:alpha-L-arabinofuranosidase